MEINSIMFPSHGKHIESLKQALIDLPDETLNSTKGIPLEAIAGHHSEFFIMPNYPSDRIQLDKINVPTDAEHVEKDRQRTSFSYKGHTYHIKSQKT